MVEKFDFLHLKQTEHGKTDISDFETVFTPILWGSFLTGENLEPYFQEKKGSKLAQKILRPPYRLLKRKFSGRLAVRLKNHFKKLRLVNQVKGKTKSLNISQDLRKQTIFDLVKNSKGINIPSFNKERSKETSIHGKIEGKVSDSDFQEGVKNCFEKTKKELMENLDRDLIMAWFGIADWMGHVYRGDMEKMKETYKKLDDFAGKVKKEFDGLVLTVSDHGMKRLGDYGDHTDMNYGYYSSNKKLGLKNPKITDFYEIIRDVLSDNFEPEKYSHEELEERESEEEFEGNEEEEIKKRMEELGYFK